MKVAIVRIGNSRGVRLPKAVLEQCALGNEADLEIEHGRVVIRPSRQPREGWDEGFADMHQSGDDALLDVERIRSTWDEHEWQW